MWTTLGSFEPTFASLFRSIYTMAYTGYEFLLPHHHRHNVLYLFDNESTEPKTNIQTNIPVFLVCSNSENS